MRVIGVVSGKGGVGKTTTTANVGAALAKDFKRKTIVVDTNLTSPDLRLHLGVYHHPYTLLDVMEKGISIEKAIITHNSGLDIIPTSLSSNKMEINVIKLRELLKELEEYEFVLLDSAPGTESRALLEMSDEFLIVTNPEVPAISDTLRITKIADTCGGTIVGVELNRVRRKKYELSVKEIESVCDAPLVAVIPENRSVRESITIGNPVVLNNPYSPAAIEFKRLAAYLAGETYSPGLKAKLKRLYSFFK